MLERLLRALKDLAISEQTLFNTYWMRLKFNEDVMFILKYSKTCLWRDYVGTWQAKPEPRLREYT